MQKDIHKSLEAAPGQSDCIEGSGIHNYIQADISRSAVEHNIKVLKERIGPDVKICAVIKSNCYGHGRDLLWPVISEKVDWVAVATPAEALYIREAGYEGPVLVFFSTCTRMGEAGLAETLDELIRKRVTLTVTSRWELDVLTTATRRTDMEAKVHVCIDTGMSRSGIRPERALSLLQEIRLDQSLRFTGIYTHLATADERNKRAAYEQIECFKKVLANCQVGEGIIRHVANSAGTIDLVDSHFTMVRPGIAIYGYQPSSEMHHRLDLKPSLRLTAHIMQIEDVPRGTGCGYGLTHVFDRDSRLGLVPVGYADGYMRSLSNKSVMKVCDHIVPVRGRISMDQTIIDLTDVPDACIGDRVEVISPNPGDPHSLEELANIAGTIPYELMCGLGSRVRRFMVD